MKKVTVLFAMVMMFLVAGTSNASLTTIGKATYMGSDYNLIYEDDSIDGGLVWLDYTNGYDTWQNQVNWASGLGSNLTVNLYDGYTTDIDWGTGWRLPLTQDQTYGYNPGSEMGHLYYDSLLKPAYGPLGDASPFNNLQSYYYWSGTEYSPNPSYAWYFYFPAAARASPVRSSATTRWLFVPENDPLLCSHLPIFTGSIFFAEKTSGTP